MKPNVDMVHLFAVLMVISFAWVSDLCAPEARGR